MWDTAHSHVGHDSLNTRHDASVGPKIFKVALTGGPCAGKTSSLSAISDYFKGLGWRVYVVRDCQSVLWCVAVCSSVLQCVAACCSVLQRVAVCCRVLQRVAVCCSVLQCVAVCCSVLQRVAVCCHIDAIGEHSLMSHAPHINESRPAYKRIMSYMYMYIPQIREASIVILSGGE